MAKRKAKATVDTKSEIDVKAVAAKAFIELAHVNDVWVNKENGHYYIHPCKGDAYEQVNREDVNLDDYAEVEAPEAE